MKIERAYQSVFLALAVGLSGCSTTAPLVPVETTTAPLEVRFTQAEVKQELINVALMATFNLYWQAHRDRNWSLRFSLENWKNNLSEKFYVAYYEKAWPLKSVVVRGLTPGNQTASINLALTFTNPETAEEAVFEIIETWTLVDGKWKHEVGDPMLKGTQ